MFICDDFFGWEYEKGYVKPLDLIGLTTQWLSDGDVKKYWIGTYALGPYYLTATLILRTLVPCKITEHLMISYGL